MVKVEDEPEICACIICGDLFWTQAYSEPTLYCQKCFNKILGEEGDEDDD